MSIGPHTNYPLFLSDINDICIFSIDFRKIFKYQITRKPAQWEPSWSMRSDRQMDGRTDMTKLIVAFRNFAKALKKYARPTLVLGFYRRYEILSEESGMLF